MSALAHGSEPLVFNGKWAVKGTIGKGITMSEQLCHTSCIDLNHLNFLLHRCVQ